MQLKNLLTALMLLAPMTCYSQSGGKQLTFPQIEFQANSRSFTIATQNRLEQVASDIKQDPSLRVVIAGNAGGTKYDQQLSWSHIDAFIQYMSEVENIDRNRFISQVEGTASTNALNLRVAGANENGPSTVAAPFPDILIR
jgi:OOP family OmpA-OmpF porin